MDFKNLSFKAILYCYKNKNGAVFLNRKDELIKQFKTYDEAVEFAEANINLINKKK